MEEYAYVLDILPPGRGMKKENLCYAVGDHDFKLFELVYKDNAKIQLGDKVYIGKDAAMRTVIDHVKRRVNYTDLSFAAQGELEFDVEAAVKADEARFISFFNKAGPVSIRKHMLEELPGLGKKTMTAILEERKNSDFKDFADLATRVPAVKSPEKLIVNRIMLELTDDERKRYLFVER